MANFVDESVDDNQEVENLFEVQAEEPQIEDNPEPEGEEIVAEEPVVEEQEEEELPSKYKGKSIADIIRMHQEAEKTMGKQGSEVGELRRIVDDFITAQSVSKQQAPEVA